MSEQARAVAILDAVSAIPMEATLEAVPRTDGTTAYCVWTGGDFEREGIEHLLRIADSVPGVSVSFHGQRAYPLPGVVAFRVAALEEDDRG